MSNILGTNIASAVVPFTTADAYPTHYPIYGFGGYREVANVEERDNISTSRKSEGMLVYVQSEGDIYQLRSGSGGLEWVNFINAVDFLDLFDTPDSYTDKSGYILKVKTDESGIEFSSFAHTHGNADITALAYSKLTDVPTTFEPVVKALTWLNDTPDSYTDQGGKIVRIKSTEDGVEFSDHLDVLQLDRQIDVPTYDVDRFKMYTKRISYGDIDDTTKLWQHFEANANDIIGRHIVTTSAGIGTGDGYSKFGNNIYLGASSSNYEMTISLYPADFIWYNKTEGWTLDFWAIFRSTSANDNIVKVSTGNQRWDIRKNSGGYVEFRVYDGGTLLNSITLDYYLNATSWYHIAICADSSGNVTLYINGNVIDTIATPFSGAVDASATLIFGDGTNLNAMIIDEVRLCDSQKYTGAFTPATAEYAYNYVAMGIYGIDGLNNTYDLAHPEWDDILSKPSTYTPASHTHGNADITALAYSKLTDVPTTFEPVVKAFTWLNDTPDSYSDQGGKAVYVKEDGTGLEFLVPPSGSGVGNFLDLTDAPDSYTGHGGKVVYVKGDESGLEFATPSLVALDDSSSDTFTGDGVETDFTLSVLPVNVQSIIVSINGVLQIPTTHYTLSDNVVSFTTAPFNAALIEVRLLSLKYTLQNTYVVYTTLGTKVEYATLSLAMAGATTGDCVCVTTPGDHHLENGLVIKNGVNLCCIPAGVTLSSDDINGTILDNNVACVMSIIGSPTITNSNGSDKKIVLQNSGSYVEYSLSSSEVRSRGDNTVMAATALLLAGLDITFQFFNKEQNRPYHWNGEEFV